MRSEYLGRFTETLLEKGVEIGMDRLKYWDAAKARIDRMETEELVAKLGLRGEEPAALSENMVFWVVEAVAEKARRVIHATRPARETAKDLYKEVAYGEVYKS